MAPSCIPRFHNRGLHHCNEWEYQWSPNLGTKHHSSLVQAMVCINYNLGASWAWCSDIMSCRERRNTKSKSIPPSVLMFDFLPIYPGSMVQDTCDVGRMWHVLYDRPCDRWCGTSQMVCGTSLTWWQLMICIMSHVMWNLYDDARHVHDGAFHSWWASHVTQDDNMCCDLGVTW